MRINAPKIYTDEQGFADIARIHAAIENERPGEVLVDCSRLEWLDANMCAPLAAAVIAPNRPIVLQQLRPSIRAILEKNGFLPGGRPDPHGTTIRCQQFEVTSSADFASYVERNFRGRGLPLMSGGLLRELRRSIFELFENAVTHSQTELGIFACGQFFPTKQRLHFCLADRGIGIPGAIRNYLNVEMRAPEAIDWAMTGQNTTRLVSNGVPGGLGLKIIRDFIVQNEGAIYVASDNGFWSVTGVKVGKRLLPAPFPGTVVDIEINTADNKAYQLIGELDPMAIF